MNVPLKQENNLNRGFGFVEFNTRAEATKAIEALNGKKYKGRTIAVDFAVSKKKYQSKVAKVAEEQAEKKAKAPVVTPESTQESPVEEEKKEEVKKGETPALRTKAEKKKDRKERIEKAK